MSFDPDSPLPLSPPPAAVVVPPGSSPLAGGVASLFLPARQVLREARAALVLAASPDSGADPDLVRPQFAALSRCYAELAAALRAVVALNETALAAKSRHLELTAAALQPDPDPRSAQDATFLALAAKTAADESAWRVSAAAMALREPCIRLRSALADLQQAAAN